MKTLLYFWMVVAVVRHPRLPKSWPKIGLINRVKPTRVFMTRTMTIQHAGQSLINVVLRGH